MDNKNIISKIDYKIKGLDKMIIATPANREALDNFAKSNNGSLTLLGGEPGIGKSTLLLQLELENLIKDLNK